MIVGPYDPTDRCTYWIRRLADGGKVLLPNRPNGKLQLIDARDLAKWIVQMIEEGVVGTYNATGPKEDLNWRKFIDECRLCARNPVDLVWVDEQFLINHQYNNWKKLPLWIPSTSEIPGLFNIDSRKAEDAAENLSQNRLSFDREGQSP